MSLIAGVDYSTKAIDVVLLDEDTDAATWFRADLQGADAFDRARDVHRTMEESYGSSLWEDVLAVGIEDPRGYNAGALYRIQGAILACLPRSVLVQPWIPSAWRKAVGLPGNATKSNVMHKARRLMFDGGQGGFGYVDWPQDACDAYCIALATRLRLERKDAA